MTKEEQARIDYELFWGVTAGDARLVRAALAAGGDPDGYLGPISLLGFAAMNGAMECVEMLIGVPDPRHSHEVLSPAQRARNLGQHEVADFIEGYFRAQRDRAGLEVDIDAPDQIAAKPRAL